MGTIRTGIDEIVYIIACIGTLGSVWIARVIISVAIRKAQEPIEIKEK